MNQTAPEKVSYRRRKYRMLYKLEGGLEIPIGELTSVDNEKFKHPVEAIQHLQQIAGAYGIGRDIHIGDTIIGIKGRVGFEAAAPMVM